MAEKYPDALPPFLIDPYGYDEDNDLIRTDMEAGPARVRKRATQTPTVFSVSCKMTYTQLKIFESWIRHKINGGVEWFTVTLDTGSGLVEHMGRYVGKCSVRKASVLRWVVSGKIEVEKLQVMSEEELDEMVPPGPSTDVPTLLSWDFLDNEETSVVVCSDPTYNGQLLEGLGETLTERGTYLSHTINGLDLTGDSGSRIRVDIINIPIDVDNDFSIEATVQITGTPSSDGFTDIIGADMYESWFALRWNVTSETFTCSPYSSQPDSPVIALDSGSHVLKISKEGTSLNMYIFDGNDWNLFHSWTNITYENTSGVMGIKIGSTYINTYLPGVVKNVVYRVIN